MKITTPIVIAGLILYPTLALGSVIVSLNNEGSTTLHEITVARGETFNVDVNLNTSMQVVTIVCQVRASASGAFDILQNIPKTPWLGGGGVGRLDPVSAGLGWGLPEPDVFPPGTATLGSLQIAVDPSVTIGTYTLVPADVLLKENRLDMSWVGGGVGPAFVVHVVPEPSLTVVVFVLAFAVCCRRSW